MITGRRKLLLADDSAATRKVLGLFFADEGLEVSAVCDGESALRELEKNPPPDIVLTDVLMPGRSGYEVCERIKSDPRLRHIPVMLLVGKFEPFNEAEARRVGADEVLTKPFQSIRDLVNKVGSLLGGESKEQSPQDEAPHAAGAPLGLPVVEDAPAATAPAQRTSAPPTAAADSGAHAAQDAHAYRHDPDASFADLSLDDRLIEATPAERFGGAARQPRTDAPPRTEAARTEAAAPPPAFEPPPTAPERAEPEPTWPRQRDASADEWRVQTSDPPAATQPEATRFEQAGLVTTPPEAEREARAAAPAFTRPAFAARGQGVAADDDLLLDLDDAEPAQSVTAAAAEADDFILDLIDESPAPAATARHDSVAVQAPAPVADMPHTPPPAESYSKPYAGQAPTHAAADEAGAFAEAAHGESFAGAAHEEPRFETSPNLAAAPDVAAAPDLSAAPFESAWELTQDAAAATEAGAAPVAGGAPPAEVEASAEKVAAHEFIEPRVVPADEPVAFTAEGATTEDSVEGDIPRPPLEAVAGHTPPQRESAAPFAEAPPTQGAAAPAAAAGGVVGEQQQITLAQLSPEVIEAIARRAVEMLSERAVQEVAWEVVPDLAERLVKQRLDEQGSK